MWSYSKWISLKGALLFPLLFSKTKNCMRNKCMGLYGNLAGRRRWYTLRDLRISIRKQGNSLKLVNYKSAFYVRKW